MRFILTSKPILPFRMYRMVLQHLKSAEADYIVAIGGGSSMDTAKAIGIIIANRNLRM